MAYTLFGHGSEPLKKEFVVPEGCRIVVKAQTDQPLTHTYFTSLMRHLLDPISESFGPMSVYTPGQSCPNFVYSLGPEYMKDHIFRTFLDVYDTVKHVTEFDIWVSTTLGVIPVPLHTGKPSIQDTFERKVPTRLKVKDLNEYLYANSIFPTKEYVHEVFESIWGADRYANLIYLEFLKDANKEANIEKLKECNKHFEITQEELCKRFPGTYYNFVCRTLRIKTPSIPYWIQNAAEWVQNPNLPSYIAAPENVKRVVRKVISNAELKRKYTVRNKYQNTRRRRRKSRKTIHESNI
jgi:hypothetical protein